MTTNISYRISVGILSALARLPLEVLYVFSDIAYFIIYYAVRYRRKKKNSTGICATALPRR